MNGKKISLYLATCLFFMGCLKRSYLIRNGVEGYIYDMKTNEPLDDATISFIDGYESNFVGTKEIKNNQDGFFKIGPVEKQLRYSPRYNEFHYPLHLTIKREGFKSDTIFIGNPIYKKDLDNSIVLLDTIYLKPVLEK